MGGLSYIEWLSPTPFPLQSASGANENGTVAQLDGKFGSLTLQVVGAGWTGTINFEATQDGTNYIAVPCINRNTLAKVTTATADGVFIANVQGYTRFRARQSGFGAGTVTVTGTATALPPAGEPADVELSGTSAVSVADGSDVALGATTDAAASAGGTGTASAKLRRISTDLNTLNATTGGTSDVVVAAGATGSNSAKLRRLTTDLDAVLAKMGTSNPSASQTRPNNTTAYTAGDVVGQDPGANMTFTTTIAAAGGFIVVGASLRIDVAAVPSGMAGFRLHLYDAAPTVIADNAVYNLPSGDRGKYLGYVTLLTPVDVGDTLWAMDDGARLSGKLASASQALYGILQTLGAYTPTASTVKTVELLLAAV